MTNTVNKTAKWEQRFAICGFISFFVLLTFDCLMKLINPYGAFVTVIAFFVIMLTYYLRDNMDDDVKRTKDEVTEFLLKHQEEAAEREKELEEFPFLEAAKKLIKEILKELSNEEAEHGQT
jgi:hypothetical protein